MDTTQFDTDMHGFAFLSFGKALALRPTIIGTKFQFCLIIFFFLKSLGFLIMSNTDSQSLTLLVLLFNSHNMPSFVAQLL